MDRDEMLCVLRATEDVDLFIRARPDNVERLRQLDRQDAAALREHVNLREDL